MAKLDQRIAQLEAQHKPHAHQAVILWSTQDDEDEQAAIARWEAENGHPLPENTFLILLVSL